MFDELDDPNPPVPGPHERGQVMARAEELVGRRRLLTGLGVAVVVALIALVVGVMRNDGSNGDLRTAAGAATTNTAPDTAPSAGETPTTVGASVLGTQFVNTTTTVAPQVGGSTVITGPANKQTPATGAPAQGTTSTTAIVCRNSTNPQCGDFRWDPPPPPNQPARMTISVVSPTQPRVGDNVVFKVAIDDPDDPSLDYNYRYWEFGDGPGESIHGDPGPGGFCPEKRYGPWTPPNPSPGHSDADGGFGLEHTYNSPGQFTVKFRYEPGGTRSCYDPYASPAEGTLTVTVLP